MRWGAINNLLSLSNKQRPKTVNSRTATLPHSRDATAAQTLGSRYCSTFLPQTKSLGVLIPSIKTVTCLRLTCDRVPWKKGGILLVRGIQDWLSCKRFWMETGQWTPHYCQRCFTKWMNTKWMCVCACVCTCACVCVYVCNYIYEWVNKTKKSASENVYNSISDVENESIHEILTPE